MSGAAEPGTNPMQTLRYRAHVTFILLALTLTLPLTAQKKGAVKEEAKDRIASLPAVIWRDPGDLATLKVFYGAGGEENAPDPNIKYTFLKEDSEGTNPKFDVEDEHGVRWKVKLGGEAQPEVAATRLVWAAGYFVDQDYYLDELKVSGLPKLHRGGKYVSSNGTVHRARLERHLKKVKKIENWDWFDTPFLNTRELNGLRVMMALINNWDLKTVNNSIYEADNELRYAVTDLGASFGKTGNGISRSKGVLKDYANAPFIESTTPENVDFVMHSRPIFADWVQRHNYKMRTDMERIPKHIPRADAKWLGQRLSQLSDEQIGDCFRAAGYTPEEIKGYTGAVRKRIEALNNL
jgi:hypothetical protein